MGVAIGTEVQKQSFNQRLGRIEAGGVNTTRHVYVGPVHDAEAAKGKRRKLPSLNGLPGVRRRSLWSELLMLPVALAAGGVAVVAARALAFHFLTEQPLYQQYAWFADVAMAAVLALVLRSVLKLTGRIRLKGLVAGFVAMVLFQPLFVQRAPDVFARLYSPAYVSDVLAVVDPA